MIRVTRPENDTALAALAASRDTSLTIALDRITRIMPEQRGEKRKLRLDIGILAIPAQQRAQHLLWRMSCRRARRPRVL